MTPLTFSPVCVPFTKMAVRASSTSFGSRASRARFERAFLGFLGAQMSKAIQKTNGRTYIVRSIATSKRLYGKCVGSVWRGAECTIDANSGNFGIDARDRDLHCDRAISIQRQCDSANCVRLRGDVLDEALDKTQKRLRPNEKYVS